MAALPNALTTGVCFKVVDIETCVRSDGLLRLVALAVSEVVNGHLAAQTRSWLVNPETPIDSPSQAIHHIKDRDVASCPPFREVSDEVLAALTSLPVNTSRVVWVAHNAPFDISVLQSECAQVEASMPNVPVIDTMLLPEHVGHQLNARLALPELAARYGIAGLRHHDAASDAETTARILIALLDQAAAVGTADLDSILIQGKRSTDYTSRQQRQQKPAPDPRTAPTGCEANHPEPLPEAPTKKQRKDWSLAFLRCVKAGCDHTDTLVTQLHQHPDVFREVAKQAQSHLTPRSPAVANYLGAIQDPNLLANTFDRAQILTWWRTTQTGLKPTRCNTSGIAGQCRYCNDGSPCPADVFYQSVARAASGAHRRGRVSVAVIQRYAADKTQLASWRNRGMGNVAAHVVWLCINEANEIGDVAAASKLRAHADTLGLVALEPCLLLAVAGRALAQDQRGLALDLVENCLATGSTDPALNRVREFYYGHLLAAPPPHRRTVKTRPRYSATARRPLNRRITARFKIA